MGKDTQSKENRVYDRWEEAKRDNPDQKMTPEELKIANQQSAIVNSLGPQVLASMGFISDGSGNIRKITDSEAKSTMAADQYAIYNARNQEADSLSKGVLPEYMQRQLDTQNQATLGAANRRLGPGGAYTSTPGNTALNQVQQNTAETVGRNKQNQVGLMNAYYGMSQQPTQAAQGFLNAGQSVLKNVYYPFHGWANDMSNARLLGQSNLSGTQMTEFSKNGRQIFGGQ